MTIDDLLGRSTRPGRVPRLADAELITLAVGQALLGVRSEARWLRFVPTRLPGAFPYLPGQFGYNKRLRNALPLIKKVIRVLARDTDLWAGPVWVVDSTPSSAPAPAPPPCGPTWPDGPATATAPATPASSGDCACT